MPTSDERFSLDIPGFGGLDRRHGDRVGREPSRVFVAASGDGVERRNHRACALFRERVNFHFSGANRARPAAAASAST
jgi:hypothetical protein